MDKPVGSESAMDLMEISARSFEAAKKRAKIKARRKGVLKVPSNPSGRTGRIVRSPVG